MTIRTSCVSGAPVALMLGLVAGWPPAAALAQGKTDVVTLANGDRITGEVKRLERGRLVFETDDAGTLYLEWDKLASVESKQRVEVTTADGQRYLGSLGPAPDRSVAVIEGTNAARDTADRRSRRTRDRRVPGRRPCASASLLPSRALRTRPADKPCPS